MIVAVLLLAPCFLDYLRFALHHQRIPCFVLLLLLQQVWVPRLQNLAQFGEAPFADRFAASELPLLFSLTWTVFKSLVGVVF